MRPTPTAVNSPSILIGGIELRLNDMNPAIVVNAVYSAGRLISLRAAMTRFSAVSPRLEAYKIALKKWMSAASVSADSIGGRMLDIMLNG